MAIKKVKLTEADLNRIVNKVIEEQNMVQDASNYLGNKIKSGANAINNATGGVAGKVVNKVVDTAKSVGNALTANNSSNQRIKDIARIVKQYKITPQDFAAAQKITPQQQRINNAARVVKQYKITPQDFAAAQKLNSGGGIAQAARTAAPKPVSPTKPAQPQAQMTPQQLQSIQGQAKRV